MGTKQRPTIRHLTDLVPLIERQQGFDDILTSLRFKEGTDTSKPVPIGSLQAWDVKTGKQVWKGYSTGPDAEMLMDPDKTVTWTNGKLAPVGKDSSLKTWQGDQWKIGGGTTWGWYSYDQQENLMY